MKKPFAEPEHDGPIVLTTESDVGNIERVMDDPIASGSVSEGTMLSVVGRVMPDLPKDSVDGEVFVTLERPGQPTRCVSTEKPVRDDLVSGYGNPGFRMAGFRARIGVDGLSGMYTLGLAVRSNGRLFRLPRHDRSCASATVERMEAGMDLAHLGSAMPVWAQVDDHVGRHGGEVVLMPPAPVGPRH